MKPQPWGVMTSRDGILYVHVLTADAPERLVLPETAGLPVRDARLFGSGVEVPMETGAEVILHLPADARNAVDTIILVRPR